MFLYDFFYIFPCIVYANIWWSYIFITSFKVHFIFKINQQFTRSKCFTIFRIHKYSIHFCIIPLLKSSYSYTLFEWLLLLDTKNVWFVWFHLVNFQILLPAFICARAIGNLWCICLVVNIFRLEWSETWSEKPVPSMFIGNILLSKAWRTLSLTSKRLYKFPRTSFLFFYLWIFQLYLFPKIENFN